MKTLIATATRYQDPYGKDRTRFNQAGELVYSARRAVHPVVLVDNSRDPVVAETLEKAGATVYPQKHMGMGPGRREVFFHAQEHCFADPEIGAVVWTEEKPDIVRLIPKIVGPIERDRADIVIPYRTSESWNSYPAYQVQSEKRANKAYREATGLDFDPMFGPVAIRPSLLGEFICFNSQKWGVPDTYIQHFVPIILASSRNTRVKVTKVEVDFLYPSAQRAEEEAEGNSEIKKKRDSQLEVLSKAYQQIGSCIYRRSVSPILI